MRKCILRHKEKEMSFSFSLHLSKYTRKNLVYTHTRQNCTWNKKCPCQSQLLIMEYINKSSVSTSYLLVHLDGTLERYGLIYAPFSLIYIFIFSRFFLIYTTNWKFKHELMVNQHTFIVLQHAIDLSFLLQTFIDY